MIYTNLESILVKQSLPQTNRQTDSRYSQEKIACAMGWLDRHMPYCKPCDPQRVEYPTEGNKVVQFKNPDNGKFLS